MAHHPGEQRGLCLDFGCGGGANVAAIRRQGYAYVGLDISRDNVETCRARFRQLPPESFVLHEGSRLPLADAQFQAVCAFDVLEHVDDVESAARELDRVLAPGGLVNVTVPHPGSERWIQSFYPGYWEDVHHVRTLDREALHRLFPGYVLVGHRREEGVGNLSLLLLRLGGCRIDNQVGDWSGGNRWTRFWYRIVFGLSIFFSESIFRTRYRYVPLWLVTYPIGRAFSRVFPKTDRYIFRKPFPAHWAANRAA